MSNQLSSSFSKHLKQKILDDAQTNNLTANASESSIDGQLKIFVFFFLKSLEINNISTLKKTLPWMYHTFYSQKFQFEYFLLLYRYVDEVSVLLLDKHKYILAQGFLSELKSLHTQMINEAKNYSSHILEIPSEYQQLEIKFKNALFNADSLSAKDIFDANVNSFDDLALFYNFVIYPAMVEVGIAWENGIITPAQEHLASSIVLEILSLLYTQIELPRITKGKIIVSTTTNEFHEIGAIMLSNTFEADGWDVTYLGCDVSNDSLMNSISDIDPLIIALSVSMPFNLEQTSIIIKNIKELNPNIKVMVGGNAFNATQIDENSFGADVYLKDIDEALKIANMWYES